MNSRLFARIYKGYEIWKLIMGGIFAAFVFMQVGVFYAVDCVYQYAFLNKRWQATVSAQCQEVKGCNSIVFDDSSSKPSSTAPQLQLLGTHLIMKVNARNGMQAQVIEEMTRRDKQTRSRQVDFQLVTAPIGNTNPGAKS